MQIESYISRVNYFRPVFNEFIIILPKSSRDNKRNKILLFHMIAAILIDSTFIADVLYAIVPIDIVYDLLLTYSSSTLHNRPLLKAKRHRF